MCPKARQHDGNHPSLHRLFLLPSQGVVVQANHELDVQLRYKECRDGRAFTGVQSGTLTQLTQLGGLVVEEREAKFEGFGLQQQALGGARLHSKPSSVKHKRECHDRRSVQLWPRSEPDHADVHSPGAVANTPRT
eukprot:scaffold73990_cov74-Phaeocystis_antarctica.AAC.4